MLWGCAVKVFGVPAFWKGGKLMLSSGLYSLCSVRSYWKKVWSATIAAKWLPDGPARMHSLLA